MEALLQAIILSLLPISELRGGIPVAYLNGIGILEAFLVCTIANMLVIPIVFFFLEYVNKLLLKWKWYNGVFERLVERSREKIQSSVKKYGYVGLMIFVAIPLPMTGAYTGTVGAWALGMEWKKSFLYIALGVLIAGIVVSAVMYFGIGALKFFIKS